MERKKIRGLGVGVGVGGWRLGGGGSAKVRVMANLTGARQGTACAEM